MTDSITPSSGKPGINPKNKIRKNSRPLEDLLLEMSMQADDQDKAVKAFNEIVARFRGYLEYTCRRVLFQFGEKDESDLVSLLSNTFLLLFQKADHLLHIESLETETEKEVVIKSWLGKVASHEATKMNKARQNYSDKIKLTDFNTCSKGTFNNDDDDDEYPLPGEIKTAADDEEEILTTDERVVFNEVLNECTEREQEIILTYYDFLDGRKHLPPEEIKRLCKKFDILPDNLNHIKHRTFKKIKSECLRRTEIRNAGNRQRE